MTAPAEIPDDSDDLAEVEPLEIPPDKRRVKTDKQDIPIDTIATRIQSGKINLQPEFQRHYVWNRTKASRLIESLLLEVPIPVVYVAEEPKKTLSVVDGQQRLTSINSFLTGKFPNGDDFVLGGLQVMKELNGLAFKDLASEHQDQITQSALRLIIIEASSDPDVKFEVFERLNLGAEKLNDMELRNCVYRGPYNDLLKALVQNKYLLKVRGAKEPDIRMKDRQLLLRFFAMWRQTHLKYKAPMKSFMNHEMEAHQHISSAQQEEMRDTFENAIEIAYLVFGEHAFRRFTVGSAKAPSGGWETTKLNIALWDTLLYTFSLYTKHDIVPVADRIREEFLDVVTNDATFEEAISRTTDKPEFIKYRADTWRQRLQALIGYSSKDPRAFSRQLKEQLFKADRTCQLCNQAIHDLDDAEVDHIKHYWRGGKTIPENARLTHRFCNRVRGGH